MGPQPDVGRSPATDSIRCKAVHSDARPASLGSAAGSRTLGIRACPNPPPRVLRWPPNIASIRSIAIVDGTCRVGRVSHSGSDRAQSATRAP